MSVGRISQELARVLVVGLSAMETLTLAAATFVTLQQNKRTFQEAERSRIKPLAIDEIQHAIDPALEALRIDIRICEHNTDDINWLYEEGHPVDDTIETIATEVANYLGVQ